MLSPLSHINQFGNRNVEPSVTTFTDVETNEQLRIDPVNDLIIVSPFRDGKPLTLRRFRETADLEAVHDPSRAGDQGVDLAKVAKDGFSDRNIFGAPVLVTVRPNPATPATAILEDGGGNDLIRVTRLVYGSQANGPGIAIAAGSTEGKKVTITSTFGAPLIGDNLGTLLSVHYTGDASTALISVLHAFARIAYTAQPTDEAIVTVTTGGTAFVFEFDDDDTITPGRVAVEIGADVDESMANLAAAIGQHASLAVTQDAANNRLTIDATDEGVVVTTTVVGATITLLPPAARLRVVLNGDQTDGSQDLDLPLTEASLSSVDELAKHINQQLGYTATIRPTANKFILSTGLDPLTSTNVKASAVVLAGYNAAIVDWITNRTRGRYLAEELGPRGIPDETAYSFAGGTTPPATINDWNNALDAIDAGQPGGIILLDTDDTAVFALCRTWLEEMRSAGRWFRVFAGAEAGLTDAAYDTIAAGVDHERFRLTWQRPLRLGATVETLHPVYFAAAMAGGAAGNLPYVNPLTNKRIGGGIVGIDDRDRRTKTEREAMIEAGLITFKREQDQTLVVLAVTTSRDSKKRMVRIMSEIDTVEQIDQAVRDRFQGFKGRWTDSELTARARAALQEVLQEFVDRGALVSSRVDGALVPAYQILAVSVSAGALTVKFQVLVGGELNHVDAYGFANYARIEEREVAVQLAA